MVLRRGWTPKSEGLVGGRRKEKEKRGKKEREKKGKKKKRNKRKVREKGKGRKGAVQVFSFEGGAGLRSNR